MMVSDLSQSKWYTFQPTIFLVFDTETGFRTLKVKPECDLGEPPLRSPIFIPIVVRFPCTVDNLILHHVIMHNISCRMKNLGTNFVPAIICEKCHIAYCISFAGVMHY
jgi:hypothetical protein